MGRILDIDYEKEILDIGEIGKNKKYSCKRDNV